MLKNGKFRPSCIRKCHCRGNLISKTAYLDAFWNDLIDNTPIFWNLIASSFRQYHQNCSSSYFLINLETKKYLTFSTCFFNSRNIAFFMSLLYERDKNWNLVAWAIRIWVYQTQIFIGVILLCYFLYLDKHFLLVMSSEYFVKYRDSLKNFIKNPSYCFI